MNRLLLAVLGLAVAVVAVGGEAASEQSLAAGEASGRALREAADQKHNNKAPAQAKKAPAGKKAKAEKKKDGKKAAKKAGKKSGKTGKKAGKKGGKKTGKKGGKKAGKKGGKKSGKKHAKSGKTSGKKHAKSGKKSAKHEGKSVGRQSCAADSACLLAAGKYYQQVLVKGVNYKVQYARIQTFNKQAGSKGGKKDDFAGTLTNMKDLGGGNASALACGGSTSGAGADSLKTAVSNLSSCSASIDAACNSGAPSINSTQATDCLNAIGNLTAGVANCSALNGTAACACWKDTKLANLSATVATCDVSAINKNATSFKAACLAAYANCKQVSNKAPNLISSCNSNAGALTGKLKTATENSNALASLTSTTNSLIASAGGSSGKRQAVSCTAYAGLVSDVSKQASQSPSSPNIAAAANSAVAKAPKACAASDLNVLQAAANVLSAAVSFVAALISSIQANLLSLTGTTASASAIAAATTAGSNAAATSTSAGAVTTKAPASGLRRMGIRQIFQRSQVAQNLV